MQNILLTAFTCLFLAGCATPPPPQVDMASGIFAAPPTQSQLNQVAGGQNKTLLVVLSQNTVANIAYLKSQQDARRKELLGGTNKVKAHIEALDPQFPAKWIVTSLKNRFGQVKLVPAASLDQQRDFDALVIVDFFYQTTDWGINHATATVTTDFYDAQLARIGRASANQHVQVRSGAPVSDDDLFEKNHQVLVATLEEWDSSLNRLVVMPSTVEAPAHRPPGRDACVRSALSVSDGALRQSAIAACTP